MTNLAPIGWTQPEEFSPDQFVVESDLDFRVDSRIYTDPWIFDQEMRRIFDRTWVYVGHTSELPQPYDFKTAMIGKNPVIVTRAGDGSIHVMSNECRHRANTVCRESRGSARNGFICPYHAWAYSISGELKGVTHANGYPQNFASELGGLERCRVDEYRGLIFASFNSDVAPIEQHLGDVRRYVDLWADLSPEPEFRVTRRPYHYGYQGNWKFQAENGNDAWHARFTHGSAFRTFEEFGGRKASERSSGGCTRGFDGGYGIQERESGIHQGLSDEQRAFYKGALLRRHSEADVEQIWGFRRHIFLFPNLYLFDNLIRVIQPISPAKTAVTSYPLLLRDVPDELNRVRLAELEGRLGTTGMVSTDDLEIFAGTQTALSGTRRPWIIFSHGMAGERRGAGSEVIGEDTSETPQRSVYRQWAKLMGSAHAGGRARGH